MKMKVFSFNGCYISLLPALLEFIHARDWETLKVIILAQPDCIIGVAIDMQEQVG